MLVNVLAGPLLLGWVALGDQSGPRQPQGFPRGIVVEDVYAGGAGGLAGLRPGDVLLSWARADQTGGGGAPGHAILSPSDLDEIEREAMPRGPVTLHGLRAGQPLVARVGADSFGLSTRVRPALPEPLVERYERGRALASEGQLEEAARVWHAVANEARQSKEVEAGCWILVALGRAAADKRQLELSRGAYDEAAACAGALPPRAQAVILESRAEREYEHAHYREAAPAYAAALEVRRRSGESAHAQSPTLVGLAHVTYLLADKERAIALFRQALAALDAEAPESLALCRAILYFATALMALGEIEEADALLQRAARVAEAIAPEGLTMVSVLSGLMGIADHSGDLGAAERHARRMVSLSHRLAPDTSAGVWLNLGYIVSRRGDDAAAEEYYGRALLIAEEGGDSARAVRSMLLHNLGGVAQARGDLVKAESLFRRALAGYEEIAPGSISTAAPLAALGETLAMRGDRAAAKPLVERALALCEARMPQGILTATVLVTLADIASAERDWKAAGTLYTRALAIRERLAPRSSALAEVLRGLGRVRRAEGDLAQASAFFSRAIEAVEAERDGITRTDDARSLFASRFFGVYHDQIELLVDAGRVPEAFHLLERSRARSLLTLMAERDLLLEDGVPPELERQRRRIAAAYERARGELEGLSVERDAAAIDGLTRRLRELRDQQDEIADKIRRSSPRLAEFRDPPPLDAEGVRASLDPGTVLLAYSVGQERTVLFVVTAAGTTPAVPGGVAAITIPIGEKALRERIEGWRALAEWSRPSPRFRAEGRELYGLLVQPAARSLRSARRILISADGPLHRLPFAALRRQGRFLAEWKALGLVASGTLQAQLVRSRKRVGYRRDLVAFGDPRYTDLDALPASRQEVQAIARLFPRAEVHVGEEATEERAKAVGRGVRYVHFASHGLIDESSPLDSALALSAPRALPEGHDNGRLHAWEIFEGVRLDAELVTLSACESASGSERAGEGLIGLTRAFQYAGARSVLASLWRVGDQSSVEMMGDVYRALRSGLPKDEALRRAQVQAIGRGRPPALWAAFQLYGDWR